MKRLGMILAALMLTSGFAQAAIDLSRYDLTPEQIALIERLEARGIAQDVLEKFAASLAQRNAAHPQGPFIPEHTLDDLFNVAAWAQGGAFYAFQKEAGLKFDQPAYMADCPHAPLFYFGKATGTTYLRLDVLSRYYNAAYALQIAYAKSPETFREVYLRQAELSGMTKYLTNADGSAL